MWLLGTNTTTFDAHCGFAGMVEEIRIGALNAMTGARRLGRWLSRHIDSLTDERRTYPHNFWFTSRITGPRCFVCPHEQTRLSFENKKSTATDVRILLARLLQFSRRDCRVAALSFGKQKTAHRQICKKRCLLLFPRSSEETGVVLAG